MINWCQNAAQLSLGKFCKGVPQKQTHSRKNDESKTTKKERHDESKEKTTKKERQE